ncbi:MAG TPA: SulP family inorganic anion transporter [Kofleriaceae bacterium]|nr:SulP family inorganic anion transporter [Kofleriaceae bacterium]
MNKTWAKSRFAHTLPRDLLASVVVFLVALPLCMGIAIASGAPPAAGLITGIVGGLVVGFLQGAPLQVSGPAAGLAVVVWQLIHDHGLAAMGMIVLGAGVLQMIAALLRGGRWFRAVPPSVIFGMLAGIGVLILASQAHVMVDHKPTSSGWRNLISIPHAVWQGLVAEPGIAQRQALSIGLLTIGVMIAWNRMPARWRLVPGSLIGVVIASVVANTLGFTVAYVAVPSSLIASVTWPSLASFAIFGQPEMWGLSFVVAAVASAETLLCAAAVDRMHAGPRTNYDRELFAQGVGNTLCGLLGALPMTGVIVRSTANVQAGGRTRLSAILHAVWILVLVVALPQLLRLIPVASLAGILVFTGYKLINPAAIRQLYRYGKSEVAIYAATALAIVATDLLKGVLVGLALAIAKLVYRMSHFKIAVEDAPDNRTTLHLQGVATFFRLATIADALERVTPDRELHIRIDDLDHLDHATLELLTSWQKQHTSKGGAVVADWQALEQRYRARGRPSATA